MKSKQTPSWMDTTTSKERFLFLEKILLNDRNIAAVQQQWIEEPFSNKSVHHRAYVTLSYDI